MESTEAKAGQKESIEDFLEALYGDPLRTETMRAGRHLVIASVITIAAVIFKVRFQSTSLIPLDFGQHVEVLPMLLALTVLLLFLSFVVWAVTDIFRDREAAVLVTRYIEGERVKAAVKAAKAVDDNLEEQMREEREGPYNPEPWWEDVPKITDESDRAVSRAEERVGIRRWPRKLRRVRITLELGIPASFAVVALVLSAGHLVAFGTALLAALWS